MPVLRAFARCAEQRPGRPHRTEPEPIDVVVAQFTVTVRRTRSVRYGYRRSDDETVACEADAVATTNAVATNAVATRAYPKRRIDRCMPRAAACMRSAVGHSVGRDPSPLLAIIDGSLL